jgi:PTH1 family peptidyl-tRNA hydrolase
VPVFIIVGLGNPGAEYEGTRHNLGFRVADLLGTRSGAGFRPGSGDFLYFRMRRAETDIVVAKPLTYMNNSGKAVAGILEQFGDPGERLLVVVDDIEIPLGTLRLRPAGSDGGHNGLASVIRTLQTEKFARLRCGIGQPARVPGEVLASFVLSTFDGEELGKVGPVVDRAADAALMAASQGIEKAMSLYNS